MTRQMRRLSHFLSFLLAAYVVAWLVVLAGDAGANHRELEQLNTRCREHCFHLYGPDAAGERRATAASRVACWCRLDGRWGRLYSGAKPELP